MLGREPGGLGAALGIDLVDIADAGFALKERGLHAARRADRVDGARGRTQRESFEGLVVLALHLGALARERRGHGLVDRGEGCRTVRAFLQLHDDPDDRRGILLGGRRNLIGLGSLPTLRGERGIDITDRQGRGRGSGSGMRVCETSRRCERRGPRHRQRAGAGKREERRCFLHRHVGNSNVSTGDRVGRRRGLPRAGRHCQHTARDAYDKLCFTLGNDWTLFYCQHDFGSGNTYAARFPDPNMNTVRCGSPHLTRSMRRSCQRRRCVR